MKGGSGSPKPGMELESTVGSLGKVTEDLEKHMREFKTQSCELQNQKKELKEENPSLRDSIREFQNTLEQTGSPYTRLDDLLAACREGCDECEGGLLGRKLDEDGELENKKSVLDEEGTRDEATFFESEIENEGCEEDDDSPTKEKTCIPKPEEASESLGSEPLLPANQASPPPDDPRSADQPNISSAVTERGGAGSLEELDDPEENLRPDSKGQEQDSDPASCPIGRPEIGDFIPSLPGISSKDFFAAQDSIKSLPDGFIGHHLANIAHHI